MDADNKSATLLIVPLFFLIVIVIDRLDEIAVAGLCFEHGLAWVVGWYRDMRL